MRLALISDLHGNLLALDAVLSHAREARVDQVICLGDVATLGPFPREVIQRLREENIRCILGNHDEFMLDAGLIHTYTEAPPVVEAVAWCRSVLSADDLDYLRSATRTLSLDLDGVDTLLVHGTPRSHMEEVLATTPDAELATRIGDARPAILAGGHTHLQLLRRFDGMTLVNPGSVGAPFAGVPVGGRPRILPHAEYATIDAVNGAFSVALHHLPLSLADLHAQARRSEHPMAAWLMAAYT